MRKIIESDIKVSDNIPIEGGIIKFTLVSDIEERFPNFTGTLVRGSFLNLIERISHEISSDLHKGNTRRPYSTEPIKFRRQGSDRNVRKEHIILPRDQFEIKIKIHSNSLLESILQHYFKSEISTLNLMNKEYRISSLEYKRNILEKSSITNKLKIYFKTPTYFSMKDKHESMLFPNPTYIFMNLMNFWNEINSTNLIPEKPLLDWIKENVVINDYSTFTRRIFIQKNTPILGFQGWVVYRFKKEGSFLNWIDFLSQLGQITNIGGNRTAGMGVIRRKWI